MTRAAPVITHLRAEDEDQRHQLRRQAFDNRAQFDPAAPVLPPGRVVAAYEGTRVVGTVARLPFQQWWGGRAVPCAGIAGVAVRPERRGLGLARKMLARALDDAAADGEVISALYPTTAELYRSMGYEVAGWWVSRSVPVADLARVPVPPGSRLDWEEVALDDPDLESLEGTGRHDGWLVLPRISRDLFLARARADTSTNRFAFVGRRGGRPAATVTYHYASDDHALYALQTDSLGAIDGDALAGALAFLGANGTTARLVRTTMPALLLGLHLPHIGRTEVQDTWPWMLRLVDVAGAIEARGYPEGLSASFRLSVHDPVRPSNDGTYEVAVEGGKAVVGRTSGDAPSISVRDLAPLYAGYVSPEALFEAGRLRAPTRAEIGLLGAVFAGTPTLPVFF